MRDDDFSAYTKPLPAGTTLMVFEDDRLVFSSAGKWLHPLFELEEFLGSHPGIPAQGKTLCAHDTAVGKAAAVLLVRMGVTRIHADLMSGIALGYLERHNQGNSAVRVTFTNRVDRLLCATEAQLEPLDDADEMYYLLRTRAKLTAGIEVSVQHVTHPFGSFDDFSLELAAGSRLIVEGENGSGKTTLLKMLCGIITPAQGTVLIGGMPPGRLSRGTIGYVPQHTDGTAFSLSAREVVALGLPHKTHDRKLAVTQALERTSAAHLADMAFSQLSGGEKQKVSLSRCLAQHAKLLLLDEPTAALDAENRRMVTDILRSLTVTEIPTIVVVTHDPELARLGGWPTMRLGASQ